MKIGFASNDWSLSMKDLNGMPVMGGSGHMRLGQYYGPLKRKGIDVVLGILAHNSVTGTFGIHTMDGGPDHFDCDIIVMQRYMHMFALRDMKRAQSAGQVIINDVDDWYWGLSEKNAAYSASDPKKNPSENRDWYRNIIEQSDGVIVSTPFLFDQIKQWNENVHIHTNYVNIKQFRDVKPFIEENPIRRLVVGWMGSTSHRSGDLEILRPIADELSVFARFHHTGHINVIGVNSFARETRISTGLVSTSPFLPPFKLQEGFLFQAGIVPLTNIPFNHAKSYIKGLEYAAAGIPFVASWSPQYEELVEEHQIGFLAKTDKDYVHLLHDLVDPEYRAEKAKDFKTRVRKFDVNNGADILLKTIKKIHKETWNAKG